MSEIILTKDFDHRQPIGWMEINEVFIKEWHADWILSPEFELWDNPDGTQSYRLVGMSLIPSAKYRNPEDTYADLKKKD
jgi:hypothetical protein